jgi:hypothetical protein
MGSNNTDQKEIQSIIKIISQESQDEISVVVSNSNGRAKAKP